MLNLKIEPPRCPKEGFLNKIQKAPAIKRINKENNIKIKSSVHQKVHFGNEKTRPRVERVVTTHVTGKGLTSRHLKHIKNGYKPV